MFIERVQIEEGFLNGLDVSFSAGLNVIIGARGTGKTSLIELIRFCLDVGGTTEIARRSRDHALSILSTGQVTVTLNNQGERILVSRTANDKESRSTDTFTKPTIFSQTEIETVGLESSGRLRLIDAFLPTNFLFDIKEDKIAADIRSLTSEIERNRREIEELETKIQLKPELTKQYEINESSRQVIAQSSVVLEQKSKALNELTSVISNKATLISEYARVKNDTAIWYNEIEAVIKSATGTRVRSDRLSSSYKSVFDSAMEQLTYSLNRVAEAYHGMAATEKVLSDDKLNAEHSARQLRSEIEGLQTGSGQVMRRAQELSEQLAKISAMVENCEKKRAILNNLLLARNELLDALDLSRKDRFDARLNVVKQLNSTLAPNIKVQIKRNGQHAIFTNTLGEILRKSGVRYGEIIPSIAANISPRALLDAVENFDFELIAETTGISFERASRILTHLRNMDLGTLSTLNIEDEVSLQLLDGTDYKDLQDLSTGQRCTVILPIVLAQKDRILIVDQPEDHIDNAFIAGTLIKSVLSRTSNSQIIFSTHNPNIPVLGEADAVLHLGSDGRRGFKLCGGPLDNKEVISSISTVMEGGAIAFKRRAEFYEKSR